MKFEIFPGPSYKIRKMENSNTNTDYHKFLRLGNQQWEMVEITIKNGSDVDAATC